MPEGVTEMLNVMNGTEGGAPVLSVIRHKSNDTANCTVPENERPKLKNEDCLGSCIEGEKLCAQYE